jgi:hypothetical protein
MTKVLVSASSGCRVFGETGERETELADRQFSAMSSEVEGSCLAVVDQHEIWRRGLDGVWMRVASTEFGLQSITSIDGMIFGGAMDEAAMVRVPLNGEAERLKGFELCSGRDEWFAGGAALGRSFPSGNRGRCSDRRGSTCRRSALFTGQGKHLEADCPNHVRCARGTRASRLAEYCGRRCSRRVVRKSRWRTHLGGSLGRT